MEETFESTPIPHKAYDANTIQAKPKNKEKDRYLHLKADAFVETKPFKKNMLVFRAQEAGIDPFKHELYKQTPGSPLPKKNLGITSRLIHRAVNVKAARLYSAFCSEHGDYVKIIPQRMSAEDPAMAMTNLENYYLRQDRYYKRKLSELFTSVEVNGVGVTKQFWNFKQSVFDVNRAPTIIKDPNSNKLKIGRGGQRKSIILTDRPELEVIDPLFFSMPRGTKYLNREGGSAMCFHLELFYNYELLALEERGYIEDFKSIVRKDSKSYCGNQCESTEMQEYYDELFDSEMNKNLEPDDPYYRRWVTKIFEIATDNTPVIETWECGGEFIRQGIWKGGHEIPYEIHVSDPGTTTWIGRSTPEKIEDNFRMLNWIMRYGLEKVANNAKDRLLIPESAAIGQVDMQRLANGEGPVVYNDQVTDGIGPKDKFIHLTAPDVSQNYFTQMQFLIQQSMEDLGISLSETAGADLPSAYRSGKLANILESQSGKVGGVAISLVGESMGRVYNQFMTMIYRLQTAPVDVILDPRKPVVQTIDPDAFEHIPDMIAYPNIQTRELSEQVIQSMSTFLPFMQGSINIPQFMKMLLQLGTSPEVARRFEEVLMYPPTPATGPSAGPTAQQPGAPVQ